MQTAGLKVLIIEDRRENIVFLANNIFRPKGFEIITARDGKTGLRKALEENPDLIITDLHVPRMHGLEIMADLHDRGSKTPFIIMTLHGSEDTAIEAFRLGARDYLIKPLKVDDVEQALERALAVSPAAPTSNNSQETTIQALEHKIAELEQVIATQQQQTQDKTTATKQKLEQELAKIQRELTHHTAECTRLSALLEQQKQLTDEAKNNAKALMQFVTAQQKEMVRQKNDARKLMQQISGLSDSMAKLVARQTKQTDQLSMMASNKKQPSGKAR